MPAVGVDAEQRVAWVRAVKAAYGNDVRRVTPDGRGLSFGPALAAVVGCAAVEVAVGRRGADRGQEAAARQVVDEGLVEAQRAADAGDRDELPRGAAVGGAERERAV